MRNKTFNNSGLEIINFDFIIGGYKKIKDGKIRLITHTQYVVNVGVNSGKICDQYSTYIVNDNFQMKFTNYTMTKILDLMKSNENKEKICIGYNREKIYILSDLEIDNLKIKLNPITVF